MVLFSGYLAWCFTSASLYKIDNNWLHKDREMDISWHEKWSSFSLCWSVSLFFFSGLNYCSYNFVVYSVPGKEMQLSFIFLKFILARLEMFIINSIFMICNLIKNNFCYSKRILESMFYVENLNYFEINWHLCDI
jgi:hypothetical protein